MTTTIPTVRALPDHGSDDPTTWGRFRVASFNRRHTHFEHPDEVGLGPLDEWGEPTITCVGLRRRLDKGTAFILSCYQHSGTAWSLRGEGLQCRFDAARIAGVLYLDDEAGSGRSYEEREEIARALLADVYNPWCNGDVYVVTTMDDGNGDSLGGVYPCDVESTARELLGLADDAEVEIEWGAA